MAQKNVVDYFNKVYDSEARKIPQLIGVSNTTNIVDVTWRTDEVTKQFKKSIKEVLDPLVKSGDIDPNFITAEVTDKKIKAAVTNTIRDVKKGGGGYPSALQLNPWNVSVMPGTYYLKRAAGGVGITFRFISSGKGAGTGANDQRIRAVAIGMRDGIYENWVKKSEDFFNKMPKTGKGTKVRTTITRNTQIAHEKQTTKGALALGLLRQNKPTVVLNGFITVTDVVDQIQDNISLNYARNFKKRKSGRFSFRYFIETSIRPNKKGSEESDITNIKQKEVKKAVNQLFVNKYGVIGATLRKLSGSDTIDKQVIDGSIDDLMVPLTKKGRPDMRFKVNKKAKPFKPMKDNFKGKKARGYATKTAALGVVVAGTRKRPQKEKRKGVDNIQRLQAIINKRLPAEVRRNMGRPALENRSGTFSNSVEIIKMGRAKTGLTADYTYMKTGGGTPPRSDQPGVYQTFENSGRWPAGYNPKDLIKKSIRNLALQYTEEKFVQLRRQ